MLDSEDLEISKDSADENNIPNNFGQFWKFSENFKLQSHRSAAFAASCLKWYQF